MIDELAEIAKKRIVGDWLGQLSELGILRENLTGKIEIYVYGQWVDAIKIFRTLGRE